VAVRKLTEFTAFFKDEGKNRNHETNPTQHYKYLQRELNLWVFRLSPHCPLLKSFLCLPRLTPKIRQKFPGGFSSLKWPCASFKPPSTHVPPGPVGSTFLCALPDSPCNYPLASGLPEIQTIQTCPLGASVCPFVGHVFFMKLSNQQRNL